MTDPTRRLKDPIAQEDGSLVTHSFATPESFDIRGGMYIGSEKVIPVIFIPGTMGTNLRVRRDVPLPPGYSLRPGDPAWRPPNNKAKAWAYANAWEQRTARQRQMILNPDLLEVDDTGDLDIEPCNLDRSVMLERGWGQIFNGSYGNLLFELQSNLEMTFRFDALGKRHIRSRWKEVMDAMQGDPLQRWGVHSVEPLTESELEKYAGYQYPIYAFGYNWLQSCGESSKRLEKRILEIIKWWEARKHECKKVILLTHSMGGLVGRACAKRIPDKIAGVIHGVMPALGAPLAYRRLACGTENNNSTNDPYGNYVAGKFADIGGRTADDTTPVLAVAPGTLELLPNQLYPRPWLHVRVIRHSGPTGPHETAFDYLHLPTKEQPNPYELYRDMHSWYRLINPSLADPAGLYADATGGVRKRINEALSTAEKFHYGLSDYYHPATFAYYGHDKGHAAYGQIRWVAREPAATTKVPLTWGNIQDAKHFEHLPDGARTVEVERKYMLTFRVEPQDAPGDDTVPHQSGAGPSGKIKQIFPTSGYRHQESFKNADMILLARYFIVKIVRRVEANVQSKE